jgi:hypothetical protein
MIAQSPLSATADEAGEDCSALFDGAAGRDTTARLLGGMGQDARLRWRFARYALISSALRGQITDLSLDGGLAGRVLSRLPDERPGHAESRAARRLSWALAGGLAVAVFSTLVVRGIVVLPDTGFVITGAATHAPTPARARRLASYGRPRRAAWRRGAPAEQRVLDEYLLTHLSASRDYAPVMVHARLAAYGTTMPLRAPRRPARP